MTSAVRLALRYGDRDRMAGEAMAGKEHQA